MDLGEVPSSPIRPNASNISYARGFLVGIYLYVFDMNVIVFLRCPFQDPEGVLQRDDNKI